MKNLLLLLLCAPSFLAAQNLYVGAALPNENYNINLQQQAFDTVFILQHGTLWIDSSLVTCNAVVVADSGRLVVSRSFFGLGGPMLLIGGGAALFERDSVSISGDLVATGGSRVAVNGCYFTFPMTYNGAQNLVTRDSSGIQFHATVINTGAGKLGGGGLGRGFLGLDTVLFVSPNILGFTMAFNDQSALFLNTVAGGVEVITDGQATISMNQVETVIIWHSFRPNTSADFAFPPVNTGVLPQSSFVLAYIFNEATSGGTGVGYNITMTFCNSVFWGVLTYPDSDLSLNSSTVVAAGHIFDEAGTQNTADNFINNQLYANFSAPLTDRSLYLSNVRVQAWNFYTMNDADLTVRNSTIGEALAFDGALTLENVVGDGSGGYFGATGTGLLRTRNTRLYRLNPGPEILLVNGNGRAELIGSRVEGNIVVANNGVVFAGNSTANQAPNVIDAGLLVSLTLDTPGTCVDGGLLPLTGNFQILRGFDNTDVVTALHLETSALDSTNYAPVATFNNPSEPYAFNHSFSCPLANEDLLLWLGADRNGTADFAFHVPLTALLTGTPTPQATAFRAYPNPTDGLLYLDMPAAARLEVFDALGRPMLVRDIPQPGVQALDMRGWAKGIYLLKTDAENIFVVKE